MLRHPTTVIAQLDCAIHAAYRDGARTPSRLVERPVERQVLPARNVGEAEATHGASVEQGDGTVKLCHDGASVNPFPSLPVIAQLDCAIHEAGPNAWNNAP